MKREVNTAFPESNTGFLNLLGNMNKGGRPGDVFLSSAFSHVQDPSLMVFTVTVPIPLS